MNAPDTPAALAAAAYEVLKLAAIDLSQTPMQKLRRERFDQPALKELGASIKEHGVLQPILVRPAGLAGRYELVAGERRYLGSKLAGKADIPAIVRVLTPLQVVEMQVIENNQREDLHKLVEAEGFEVLMKQHKLNADAIAEKIGKSRSYVYGVLKYCDLCPEARRAFFDGKLDASRALLVARIGHHDTQRQAMKELTKADWQGETMSYREAREYIHRNYTLALKSAPFDPKDAALVPKAGTCAACPKRTGNQPDLFADIKSADVCTDPKCFAEKRDAHWAAVRKAAEAKGQVVIGDDAASKIFLHKYDHHAIGGGYLSLDATCWDDPKHRKVSEILAKTPDAIELAQNPHTGAIVKIAKASAVTEALNSKGVKTFRQKNAEANAKHRKAVERDQAADQIEDAIADELWKQVHAKLSGKLGAEDLRVVALYLLHTGDIDYRRLAPLWNLKDTGNAYVSFEKLIMKAPADKLAALILELVIEQTCQTDMDQGELRDAARRYKVDLKAIEKRVRAELAKPAPAKAANGKKK